MTKGFSLVELSIVLVILGLLTGGILTGQTLIRASELRAVTAEFQSQQSAINTFRNKYFAIPGDLRNATDFWGTFGTGGCPTGSGVGTQTCDGDGDGRLTQPAAAAQAGEVFLFWQHLANANLIEGAFNGIAGAADNAHHIAGVNAPRSKLDSGCWGTTWWGTQSGSPSAFDGEYRHVIALGKQGTGSFCGAQVGTEIMRAEEAWNIDTKLDDGRPGTGLVVAHKQTAKVNCTTSDNGATAEYALTNSAIGCTLIIRAGY